MAKKTGWGLAQPQPGKAREEKLYYQVLWESELQSVEGFREPEKTCTSDINAAMWGLGHFIYHLLTS